MNLMTIKLLVLLACLAHLMLWRCDWVITCLKGGRFNFQYMKDNEKLSDVMADTPLRQPMFSIISAFGKPKRHGRLSWSFLKRPLLQCMSAIWEC